MKQLIKKIDIKIFIFTLILIAITIINILNYTGKNLEGNINWLFMESQVFGVPEDIAKEQGIEPYFSEKSGAGWDGQFHYYISNDILATKGYDANVDSPSYRWQRIGLPLIAKILSIITFQKNVNIPTYIFANLILYGIAIYVLARYFKEKQKSILYVLPWALCLGVQITIRHGLVDAAADALFIVAFISVLKNKYLKYCIFMTLACLTREGYTLIAFMIFLLSFFGQIDKEKKYKISFSALFAIPGVFFLAWYGYVTLRFHILPAQQAYGITQVYMTGFIQYIVKAAQDGNVIEMFSLCIYAVSIILMTIITYKKGYEKRIYWSICPYVILIGSFGPTVMSHYSGYLKGISILFALLPIMMIEYENMKVWNKNIIIAFLLITTISSIYLGTKFNIHSYPTSKFMNNGTNLENGTPLKDFSSSIDIINHKERPYANIPMKGFFTKDYEVYTVKVKNNSNEQWPRDSQKDGRYAVYLSYHWLDANDKSKILQDGLRTAIPKNIQPGEEFESQMYIEYPNKKGDYILRISLVQEGVAWFYNAGGAYKDINIKVE
ncbi:MULTISPECIES: hypothetical protein [unclassified Clostridium]|uniref:hypothetical protein n=1 Tax=unclassified Clostridium TaxID=2614128 RepID=UPI000297DB5E|nr:MULTISPECIES: hypothetical protein [unclassified Clostridium]EKQ50533.1 MAG: hypothetical protein A370_05537 [Clostridium sp. Maddingley MBC34-26]